MDIRGADFSLLMDVGHVDDDFFFFGGGELYNLSFIYFIGSRFDYYIRRKNNSSPYNKN